MQGIPRRRRRSGPVDLTTGLEHSINSVFCNIGKTLGAGRILGYAKRYGFYEDPPLETPGNERAPSGLYHAAKLFRPSDPATQVDPAGSLSGRRRCWRLRCRWRWLPPVSRTRAS